MFHCLGWVLLGVILLIGLGVLVFIFCVQKRRNVVLGVRYSQSSSEPQGVDYNWSFNKPSHYDDESQIQFLLEIIGTDSTTPPAHTDSAWNAPVISKTLSDEDYQVDPGDSTKYSYTLADQPSMDQPGTYYWSRMQFRSSEMRSAWDYSSKFFTSQTLPPPHFVGCHDASSATEVQTSTSTYDDCLRYLKSKDGYLTTPHGQTSQALKDYPYISFNLCIPGDQCNCAISTSNATKSAGEDIVSASKYNYYAGCLNCPRECGHGALSQSDPKDHNLVGGGNYTFAIYNNPYYG